MLLLTASCKQCVLPLATVVLSVGSSFFNSYIHEYCVNTLKYLRGVRNFIISQFREFFLIDRLQFAPDIFQSGKQWRFFQVSSLPSFRFAELLFVMREQTVKVILEI
mgnify:CR=1 FL=1